MKTINMYVARGRGHPIPAVVSSRLECLLIIEMSYRVFGLILDQPVCKWMVSLMVNGYLAVAVAATSFPAENNEHHT